MRKKKVSLAADPKKTVLKTRACIPGRKRESVVFEITCPSSVVETLKCALICGLFGNVVVCYVNCNFYF